MALPKIKSPTFEIVIPSINKGVDFRPFLVKEEKILLMASQSGNDRDIVKAIKQIINNCCTDDSLNVNDLTVVDLELIFLKLRSRSVNNVVDVAYKDSEDGQEYKFQIDLEEVKVVKPKEVSNKIQINDELGIIMSYPNASIIDEMGDFENEVDILNFFISKCMSQIYDEDNVYEVSEQTEEEVKEFIDSLDVKTFDKIREFFDASPKLEYVIEYKNSLGNDRRIVLDTLRDFFILG